MKCEVEHGGHACDKDAGHDGPHQSGDGDVWSGATTRSRPDDPLTPAPAKRKYDSTVARIAGNIMGGLLANPALAAGDTIRSRELTEKAVDLAEAIVAEVERRAK